jgi:putative PIN family toxin of toxin-antitoxin system
VSAFLTEEGLAAEVLKRCAMHTHLYTAEAILQETRRVLLEKEYIRRKYVYTSAQVEGFIDHVRTISSVLSDLPDLKAVERDPKDDFILSCAVEANADYLVSRDPHLLDLKTYRNARIVQPEAFIKILRSLS